MLYSSNGGCLFYYDSVLYSWKIAEPTLLFLLGLEAITSNGKSPSDSIIISKYIYKTSTDSLEPLEYIRDIYDDIYSFLSRFGSVEDFEHYLKFNCFGLKLLLNEITGTGTDRIVPVIFKSDSNRSLLNITDPESNLSYYDLLANKVYNIFNDAGYDTKLFDKEVHKVIAEYFIRKETPVIKNILNSFSKEDRRVISKDINVYNNRIDEVHQSRVETSEIYRLLDYKAMYAYALGVLYGCRCLGYSDKIIWRLDPKYWYNDIYFNLVRTAWHVFRFHWTVELEDITDSSASAQFNEKYKGIQDNKLWNFVNSADTLGGIPLAKDELSCFCMYLNDKHLNDSTQVIYSASANDPDPRGSYLTSYTLNDKLRWKWVSVSGDDNNEAVVNTSDGTESSKDKGLVSSKDTVLIRYFGYDPIYLYKAYEYEKDKYLSPEVNGIYKNYYVYTGNLGWIYYDPNQIIDTHDSDRDQDTEIIIKPKHTYLYILPKPVDKNSLNYAISADKNDTTTDDDKPKSVITYYTCYFPPDGNSDDNTNCMARLYGIYNKYINKAKDQVPSNFDEIISDKLFDERYNTNTDVEDPTSTGYASKLFYDLSSPIYLYVKQDKSVYFIYDGDDSKDDKPISHYGYSETPSIEITLFSDSIDNKPIPDSTILRYNKDYNKYWNATFFTKTTDGWNIWHPSSDVSESSNKSFYLPTDKSTYLYRGEKKLTERVDTCNKTILAPIYKKFASDDSDKFVYIDVNNLIHNNNIKDYKFIELGEYSENINNYKDTLYYSGITPYLCAYVLTDDNGNALVDSNDNPLVWHDPMYNVYWNGLFGINRWQKIKPTINSMAMFDSETNSIVPVFIYEDYISIDGEESITFDEFYSDPHRGIIREKLQVFNPNKNEGIITCYCDTKLSDFAEDAIYCIPNVSYKWGTRSSISELGYWFVDGTDVLYSGTDATTVVFDDDHTD
jgi:hypothetical protein